MEILVVEIFRWVAILTFPLYLAFDWYDRQQIKDEREELVRLKTYELIHRVTIATAAFFAILYLLFWREMNAVFPLVALSLATMGTEIIGKFYFRAKL